MTDHQDFYDIEAGQAMPGVDVVTAQAIHGLELRMMREIRNMARRIITLIIGVTAIGAWLILMLLHDR